MIAGHNLLDGIQPATFGKWAWVWNILHVIGDAHIGSLDYYVLYPFVPWAGVMVLGYAVGRIMRGRARG